MKRIQVENRIGNVPNIQEIMPQEVATGAKMQADGFLEHVYLKSDNSGALLVFKNADLAKVKELVSTFPLFKYWTDINYTEMDMQY
jgi:muconolactone delta-isomerase